MHIKILLVEDQKLMRIGIQSLFCDYPDLEIIGEATNGKDAIEKAKLIKPDVILMDIMMPIMSGERALRELKKNPNFNTPVIALTADAISGSEKKYLEEGFVDYIAKPFSKDQIKVKLDRILANTPKKEEKVPEYNPDVDRFAKIWISVRYEVTLSCAQERTHTSVSTALDANVDPQILIAHDQL